MYPTDFRHKTQYKNLKKFALNILSRDSKLQKTLDGLDIIRGTSIKRKSRNVNASTSLDLVAKNHANKNQDPGNTELSSSAAGKSRRDNSSDNYSMNKKKV